MLEGERSGRIVRRGARSLLNLPNTASPIPRLPFLLSSVKSSAASSYAAKLLLFSRRACRSPRVFVPYIFHPFVGAAQYVT